MNPAVNRIHIRRLARTLALIKVNDQNYKVRYQLVLDALLHAKNAGMDAGIGYDHDSRNMDGFRIVVYIVLPTGQVSWHMPEWGGAFDGHSTPQKFVRIDAFVRMVELEDGWQQ